MISNCRLPRALRRYQKPRVCEWFYLYRINTIGTEPETDEDWDALLEAESKIDFDWSTLGPRVRKGEAALREFLDSTKAKVRLRPLFHPYALDSRARATD